MSDELEIEVGQLIAGKFRVERVLGAGGMGIVAAATHIHLDEQVALKFLRPEALDSREAVERFAREARAAAKIKSEHVARVSDVGTLETGSPYMVMEYLSGSDLKEHLARSGGTLSVGEAISCVIQACDAIGEAHAQGIIHRDLKPANLFRTLRADGSVCVKVLDFGISKLTKTEGSMTRTSTMLGSPYYMSPEQMTSAKGADHRTDIWALAVIVYQLVSGKVPFPGETIAEVCQGVLTQTPMPLSRLVPGVPEEMDRVIARALEKSREARYANVHDFAAALAPFGSVEDARMADRISRVLGVASTSGAERESDPPGGYREEAREESTLAGAAHTHAGYQLPTRRTPWTLVAFGVAGVVGMVGWKVTDTSDAEPAATDSSQVEPEGAIPSPEAISEKTPSARQDSARQDSARQDSARQDSGVAPTADLGAVPASADPPPSAPPSDGRAPKTKHSEASPSPPVRANPAPEVVSDAPPPQPIVEPEPESEPAPAVDLYQDRR